MAWKPDTKARCWMIVVHIACLKALGITDDRLTDYEYIADVVANAWCDSGNGRTCAVIVCISADGVLHVHVAAYGPPTTLRCVAKIFGNAHVEPQLAGKKKLRDYLLKLPPWDEKGEKILYSLGVENIQDVQGNRSDLDEIAFLLKEGASPQQIFDKCFRYRKYENMILKAFFDIKASNMPIIKEMNNYWHWGAGRTGKSYVFVDLCNKFGRENVYFMTDFMNGGLDKYMLKGAPRILFVDDVKPEDMRYRQMLMLTDKYSDAQTHSRYANTLNLWNEVHVTSVYPIDEYYRQVVPEERRKVDTFDQLKGRFNTIVYHFIDKNDSYNSYSMNAKDYVCSGFMRTDAHRAQYPNNGLKELPQPRELSEEEKREFRKRGIIL